MSQSDTANYGKVAVLMGGDSSEREISLRSGQAVLDALRTKGVDAWPFDPDERPISDLKADGFDRAFIALHGTHGEDGVMQATLSMMGIPFTGSNMLASAIGMDKVRSKLIWQALNMDVIPGEVLEVDQVFDAVAAEQMMQRLGDKLMVKPATEGSSIGMTVTTGSADLVTAVDIARNYSERVLIESWMSGPEYTVAILGKKALPAIRIQPQGDFYDYTAKYEDAETEYFCPCGLDTQTEQAMADVAVRAYLALGCEGWGRVDFMFDSIREHYFLMELNTVPGMTPSSLVPKAATQEGISFEELCLKILDGSLKARVGG